jgi:ABC-type branched-subunit amino acid transport system ATPase component
MFGLVTSARARGALRGEDITNLPANKLVALGVGYVPQTNNVFPSLTIEENLEMGPTCGRATSGAVRVRHRHLPVARRPPGNAAGQRSPVASGRWSRWDGP